MTDGFRLSGGGLTLFGGFLLMIETANSGLGVLAIFNYVIVILAFCSGVLIIGNQTGYGLFCLLVILILFIINNYIFGYFSISGGVILTIGGILALVSEYLNSDNERPLMEEGKVQTLEEFETLMQCKKCGRPLELTKIKWDLEAKKIFFQVKCSYHTGRRMVSINSLLRFAPNKILLEFYDDFLNTFPDNTPLHEKILTSLKERGMVEG